MLAKRSCPCNAVSAAFMKIVTIANGKGFGGNHNLTIIFVEDICAISEIKMAYRNSFFFQSGKLE